jgi:hypothetical protein
VLGALGTAQLGAMLLPIAAEQVGEKGILRHLVVDVPGPQMEFG